MSDLKQFEHVGDIFDDENGAIERVHADIVAAFRTVNKSASRSDMKLRPLILQAQQVLSTPDARAQRRAHKLHR